MRDWLLFCLSGPRASFGTEETGWAKRGTSDAPTRSALLGLIASAMGIPREDNAAHENLAASLLFAARIEKPGREEVDYHTAQVAPRTLLKNRAVRMRQDELDVPRDELTTILSDRFYRCDYQATVAVTLAQPAGTVTLPALARALREPRWQPYLGRKSAPLAWPMSPLPCSAALVEEAFANWDAHQATLLEKWSAATAAFAHEGARPSGARLRRTVRTSRTQTATPLHRYMAGTMSAKGSATFVADAALGALVPAQHVHTQRRDQPRDRVRWLFAQREELRWKGQA
jgi:CRISPR system Cascade subunit CasD